MENHISNSTDSSSLRYRLFWIRNWTIVDLWSCFDLLMQLSGWTAASIVECLTQWWWPQFGWDSELFSDCRLVAIIAEHYQSWLPGLWFMILTGPEVTSFQLHSSVSSWRFYSLLALRLAVNNTPYNITSLRMSRYFLSTAIFAQIQVSLCWDLSNPIYFQWQNIIT